MAHEARTAKVELARRRVKRAAGQLREAARDLGAALEDDADVVGVTRATWPADVRNVTAAVQRAVDRYGEVQVVVIARPGRTPHHGPARGEGDTADAHQEARDRDRPAAAGLRR